MYITACLLCVLRRTVCVCSRLVWFVFGLFLVWFVFSFSVARSFRPAQASDRVVGWFGCFFWLVFRPVFVKATRYTLVEVFHFCLFGGVLLVEACCVSSTKTLAHRGPNKYRYSVVPFWALWGVNLKRPSMVSSAKATGIVLA